MPSLAASATFRVRDIAPDVLLIGNIGLSQLTAQTVQALVELDLAPNEYLSFGPAWLRPWYGVFFVVLILLMAGPGELVERRHHVARARALRRSEHARVVELQPVQWDGAAAAAEAFEDVQ